MSHESFAHSDVGKVRSVNEDAMLVDGDLGVYAVCDGCGGHRGGKVAGALAVETIAAHLAENAGVLRRCAKHPMARRRMQVIDLLAAAVSAASSAVLQRAEAEPDLAGMGTTVAMAAVLGEVAFLAHVGDSRVYLYRNGQLHRLTDDHTLAGEYVRLGMLDRRKARASQLKDMVTRVVGHHEVTRVDALTFDLAGGDMLLLCSDGVTDRLRDDEIARAFVKAPPEAIPRVLIDAANRRGGQDNATAVVVRTPPAPAERTADLLRRIKRLKGTPLFRYLNYRELLRVMEIVELETYVPGNRILAEGETSDRFFISTVGSVHVVKGGKVVAKLPPGSLFGEMGLIDSAPRSADVIAPKGARLMAITCDDFAGLLRREKHLAVKVLWGLSQVLNRRLRATTEQLSTARRPVRAAPPPAPTKLDELAAALRPFA